MFCGSQKTVALGIPLLRSIYGSSGGGAENGGGSSAGAATVPSLALLSAPLLFYHPIQLIIGTCLVPQLRRYVAAEQHQRGKVQS